MARTSSSDTMKIGLGIGAAAIVGWLIFGKKGASAAPPHTMGIAGMPQVGADHHLYSVSKSIGSSIASAMHASKFDTLQHAYSTLINALYADPHAMGPHTSGQTQVGWGFGDLFGGGHAHLSSGISVAKGLALGMIHPVVAHVEPALHAFEHAYGDLVSSLGQASHMAHTAGTQVGANVHLDRGVAFVVGRKLSDFMKLPPALAPIKPQIDAFEHAFHNFMQAAHSTPAQVHGAHAAVAHSGLPAAAQAAFDIAMAQRTQTGATGVALARGRSIADALKMTPAMALAPAAHDLEVAYTNLVRALHRAA
jgi:hypothetical protein